MGINFLKSVVLVFIVAFVSVSASAAKPASYCSLEGEDSNTHIEGIHSNERLPIGSVSKLVTTYWALSAMKSDYRFPTRIYISPIPGQETSTVDLHFEGSRDPYFGKESLHYLISELNKMQIYKIRDLTFDRNFKFFWNANGGPTMTPGTNKVETGYYGPDAPTADQVTTELKKYRKNLAFGYSKTRAYLKNFNIELSANAKLSVQNVKFVSSEEFHVPDNSVVRMIYSSPLVRLLKEMNRNSNNHAANQIFEHLGGADKFKEFIHADGFSDDDILFVNGHGNRKDIDATDSVYNEASCEAIVKIMTRLRKKLVNVGMDMDDVLAVPGLDEHSTLGAYQNKPYADSMAAKTGTVGPAVTLAGVLQSKNGPVFFMYNMSTEGTKRDWGRARKAIAVHLTNLTKKFNGGIPFDSHQVKFVAFDAELFFHEDDWKGDLDPEDSVPTPVAAAVPEAKAPVEPKQTSTATIHSIGPNFSIPEKQVTKVSQAPAKTSPAKSAPVKPVAPVPQNQAQNQTSTATIHQIYPNFNVPIKSVPTVVSSAPVKAEAGSQSGRPLKTYKLTQAKPAAVKKVKKASNAKVTRHAKASAKKKAKTPMMAS